MLHLLSHLSPYPTPPVSSLTLPYTSCLISHPTLHLLSHLSPYPTPPVSSLTLPYTSCLISHPTLPLLSQLSPAPMHPAVNTSQLSLGLSHTMFVTASRTVVSKKRSVVMRSVYFEGKEGKVGNEGNEFVR
jgi:hypothetical protein